MQMRVESRVHTDDSGGWTFFRKHADEDEIGVVDPVKGVVWASINTLFSQRGNAFLSALEVGDKLVVFVLAGVDVCNGGLCGLGVLRYGTVPVRVLCKESGQIRTILLVLASATGP